jgi:site-specific recombinase XerC
MVVGKTTWFGSDQALVDRWIESLGNLQPKTLKVYLESLLRFQEAHDASLSEMTVDSLDRAFEKMTHSWRMSKSTLRATKTPLRRILHYLVEQGEISVDDSKPLLKALYQESQVREPIPVVLDFRLSELLIQAPLEPRLVIFLTVVVGLTLAEIHSLTWNQIIDDHSGRYISVKGKKRSSARVISFDQQGWDFLMGMTTRLPSYEKRDNDNQPLLTGVAGKALTYVEIHKLVQGELKKHSISANPAQICPNGSTMGERYILVGFDLSLVKNSPLPPPNPKQGRRRLLSLKSESSA